MSIVSGVDPVEIFFSYSHKDEELREQLEIHLAMLQREGIVRSWHDRHIIAGQDWSGQIDAHMNTANIILLLVSPDFLASDYCYDVEVKHAMRRHESGEIQVIPVILRTCDWSNSPFSKLQALPKDAKPITRWNDRDEAFLDVTRGIRNSIKNLRVNQSASSKPIEPPSINIGDGPKADTSIDRPVSEINLPILRPSVNQPYQTYGSDLPPLVDAWVGRKDELAALSSMKDGVVAITGIGGQGKSTLVAKYLEMWTSQNPEGFWDWRDCREEGERFYTQIIALIEHLTEGVITGEHFLGADTKAVIKYLFELVGDKHGVIVLDNVDHYVNEAEGEFSLGVGWLIQEALRVRHNLLIILTCRPRISYANPRFLEISLSGITLPEAFELFQFLGVKVNQPNWPLIEEMWRRTEGHPLWLNLIAVQMFRSPSTAPNILQELRRGQVDDRTRSMFRALLRGLNDRQRIILRCMAEIPYSATEETIKALVGDRIKSPNQFNRAFKGLRSLSLVVERGSNKQGIKVDLHPLVRGFIKTEYPTVKERLPFIQAVLNALAGLVGGLTEPSENASLEFLQHWTAKAELELASDNYVEALKTISKAADRLIARGFHEEFFRVAKLILDDIDWHSIEVQDLPQFHDVVNDVISSLVEHNREEEARQYLDRYGESGGSTTVARMRFCKVATYLEWIVGNHQRAIAWGRQGVELKSQSGIDTQADTSHTLALALRDAGEWNEALRLFAPDQTIEEILAEDHNTSNKGATFYGNVGRCLQFKGQMENALNCYVKAIRLLQDGSSATDVLNKGYASLWIGEALEGLRDYEAAYNFYGQAVQIWFKRAPLRVVKPKEKLESIRHLVDDSLASISETSVSIYCQNWIADYWRSHKGAT